MSKAKSKQAKGGGTGGGGGSKDDQDIFFVFCMPYVFQNMVPLLP